MKRKSHENATFVRKYLVLPNCLNSIVHEGEKPYECRICRNKMGYNTKYYKKPKPLSHISPKPLNHTIFQNYLPLQLTETSKYYNPNH